MTIPDIVPNIHPLVVHFPIALLSVAAGLYFISILLPDFAWSKSLLMVARINLLLGTLGLFAALITGDWAFDSVSHAGGGHHAMLDHRFWATVTTAVWVVIAIASFFLHKFHKPLRFMFLVLLATGAVFIAITGHKGGEVVFLHGVGVAEQQP